MSLPALRRVRAGQPAGPVAEGSVLGLVFLAVYLLTRTRDLGGDGTVFALVVERWLRGEPDWSLLAHPHHPLYNLLVGAAARLADWAGLHPPVVDVGAAVSALFAALVVSGLVVVLRRAGLGEGVALAAALLAGVSGALWSFGTSMEVYTLEAASVLLWAAVLGRERPRPAAVAGALGLAVLAHLATGLLVFPTAWRLRRRPRAAVLALAAGLGGAGAVWLALQAGLAGRRSLGALAAALRPGGSEGWLGAASPVGVLQALQAAFSWEFYRIVPVLRGGVAEFFSVLGGTVAAAALVLVLAGGVLAVRKRSPLQRTAALGTAAFLPLWLVWDTGNVEHVVGALPLLVILAAGAAAELPAPRGAVILTVLAAVLGVVNGLGSAIPASRPENSRVMVVASFVHRTVPGDGLLLMVGRDARLRLGLPYLSGRRVRPLALLLEGASRAGAPPEAALRRWIAGASGAGSVWVDGDVFQRETAAWLAARGVPEETWLRVRGEFHVVDEAVLPPDGVVVEEPVVLARVVLWPPEGRSERGRPHGLPRETIAR